MYNFGFVPHTLCIIIFGLKKSRGNKKNLKVFICFRNKEAYWHKLSTFFKMNSTKFNDENILKQFSYALTIYFLYCLHEYSNISQNSGSFVLLEAFIGKNVHQFFEILTEKFILKKKEGGTV